MQHDDNLKRTVIKNASANLLRLAGSGVVALLLPPFLVRMLPKDVYGAWALLLQLTLYVGYLDFGIQTAVARFVAHTTELDDFEQRDGIVSTALVMLSGAAILGVVLTIVLVLRLPEIFSQMPPGISHPAKIALLLMGVSFAIGLPVSVIHALFIGLQRNEIPAALVIANKLALALFTIVVVLRHAGLAAMGAAVAVANLFSYFAAVIVWRAWGNKVRIRLTLATRAYARQIGGYSATLVIWMVAMLMVTGLDLSIVGIFDYHATAYYAVAASLTTFLAQAQGALFAALLPASAVLGARGDAYRLGTMLVSSTRYGMLILLAMALPLLVAGHLVIRLWVGPDYAQHSTLILQVLILANVIRLCALPYATLLLGTGQQGKVVISPIAEGVTNLTVSVVGAYLMGAIGVAIGTLIGSFVSLGLHLLYNMPRTSLIPIDRRRFVKEGLLRPLACAAPFGFVLALRFVADLRDQSQILLISIAALGAVLLLWNYGLIGSERKKLAHALRLL